MTRSEILSVAKPILFNTEMVRAILEGRKTVTRRPIKQKYSNTHIELRDGRYGKYVIELQNDVEGVTCGLKNPDGTFRRMLLAKRDIKQPYKTGDYLYVRETWCKLTDWEDEYPDDEEDMLVTYYRADYQGDMAESARWRPSIHMPKEAARIFLRVTDVRVERLQDCGNMQAKDEGCTCWSKFVRTVKRSDLAQYGWEANPWVWVIEFERVEVEQ